jgi:hypothetical protein
MGERRDPDHKSLKSKIFLFRQALGHFIWVPAFAGMSGK